MKFCEIELFEIRKMMARNKPVNDISNWHTVVSKTTFFNIKVSMVRSQQFFKHCIKIFEK